MLCTVSCTYCVHLILLYSTLLFVALNFIIYEFCSSVTRRFYVYSINTHSVCCVHERFSLRPHIYKLERTRSEMKFWFHFFAQRNTFFINSNLTFLRKFLYLTNQNSAEFQNFIDLTILLGPKYWFSANFRKKKYTTFFTKISLMLKLIWVHSNCHTCTAWRCVFCILYHFTMRIRYS